MFQETYTPSQLGSDLQGLLRRVLFDVDYVATRKSSVTASSGIPSSSLEELTRRFREDVYNFDYRVSAIPPKPENNCEQQLLQLQTDAATLVQNLAEAYNLIDQLQSSLETRE